jgi:asparagine synthase (glutamine-hydrolysing)
MCGIAGIIGRTDEPNQSALARMSRALIHRGPDAQGEWIADPDDVGRGVLLAHRRLSILDLSPAGAQPMRDPATGNVIVFNGEIYNYAELRDVLEVSGERFQSTGDTAVLLRALGVHGLKATADLRGMFAFAYWDAGRRQLVLARDPLGIKPLYIARNPLPHGAWSLAFASEVRALLASGLLGTPRLNPGAAASMVWNGFVAGPESAVLGVELLWPGEARVFDDKGVEVTSRRFWSLPAPRADPDFTETRLATALEKSVRLHIASDVPLAVFLSGGVDSSAVANLAQRASPSPINTFTLAFEEREYDESAMARAIAAAIGTRHQQVVLTEGDFVDQLDAAAASLDQPTFDGLNSFYMSRAVREAGFKVALVGTGGDELFGGYTSFRDLPVLHASMARASWIPARVRDAAARLVARALQPASGSVPAQTRWAKLPQMVRCADDLVSLYQLAYALFLPAMQRDLLRDISIGDLSDGLGRAMRSRVADEIAGRSTLSSISVMEQRLFLGERLLRDTDAASMASSLELRLPLVDQVLIEHAMKLPDHVRYRPVRKKALLRRVGLRGLDPALFDRPKSGFVLPYDRWIRLRLGKVMDETMRDGSAVRRTGLDPAAVARVWQGFLDGNPGIYWSRVWALYVLVRWSHQHRVFV